MGMGVSVDTLLHKGAMVGGLYRGEAIFSSFWRCFPKCVRAVRESPRRGFVFLRAAARGNKAGGGGEEKLR